MRICRRLCCKESRVRVSRDSLGKDSKANRLSPASKVDKPAKAQLCKFLKASHPKDKHRSLLRDSKVKPTKDRLRNLPRNNKGKLRSLLRDCKARRRNLLNRARLRKFKVRNLLHSKARPHRDKALNFPSKVPNHLRAKPTKIKEGTKPLKVKLLRARLANRTGILARILPPLPTNHPPNKPPLGSKLHSSNNQLLQNVMPAIKNNAAKSCFSKCQMEKLV